PRRSPAALTSPHKIRGMTTWSSRVMSARTVRSLTLETDAALLADRTPLVFHPKTVWERWIAQLCPDIKEDTEDSSYIGPEKRLYERKREQSNPNSHEDVGFHPPERRESRRPDELSARSGMPERNVLKILSQIRGARGETG
ncbi:unnamed protein product, partial [Amoebophrya sp. A25]